MKKILINLSSFLFILFLSAPKSEAKEHPALNYIEVPVLFATTRARDELGSKNFTGRRNLNQVDHGLTYGTVTVTVATPHELTAELIALGCKRASKKQLKDAAAKLLPHEVDFANQLTGIRAKRPEGQITIFIHGYNNPFNGAAGSAARMELALAQPVILFSWPSQAKLKDYVVDECNAEWSVRPFQIFMGKVEQAFGPQAIFTVSHSMGNRLINWYLQSRSDKNQENPPHYAEIVLTSPDIDRATFKNYFWKVSDNADKVRLYMSSKDKPLKGSGFLHGSERAGSAAIEKDLRWQVPSNLKGVQVIDFTSADEGWLGHSIQYDIISSMHKMNKPGSGLEAVEDREYKGAFLRIKPLK